MRKYPPDDEWRDQQHFFISIMWEKQFKNGRRKLYDRTSRPGDKFLDEMMDLYHRGAVEIHAHIRNHVMTWQKDGSAEEET